VLHMRQTYVGLIYSVNLQRATPVRMVGDCAMLDLDGSAVCTIEEAMDAADYFGCSLRVTR
jgi:hypothetical protein